MDVRVIKHRRTSAEMQMPIFKFSIPNIRPVRQDLDSYTKQKDNLPNPDRKPQNEHRYTSRCRILCVVGEMCDMEEKFYDTDRT
jgi:hypothetical protein